ncbi:signal peptide peptidase SppA [Candidatus Zixiibacteriota bacterium]
MAKRRDVVIGAIILFAFIGFVFFSVVALMGISEQGMFEWPSLGSRVAVVEVTGTIYSSTNVVRQIKKYTEDGSILAIVLRVDSPGGGVAASQEIHSQLEKARDEGKVIVASMGSVAASGGLYIAMAADTIVANPGTLTGSIGVILQYQTINELAGKIGIRSQVIKSGALKDVGSPWREPTEEDLAHLQSVIDDTYEQFVAVVADGRGMDPDQVRPLADGRIFSGRQAREANLVDVLGDLDDALDIAAEMVGLDTPPRTVKEIPRRRATIWDFLGRWAFGLVPGLTPEGFTGPQLLFLYQ